MNHDLLKVKKMEQVQWYRFKIPALIVQVYVDWSQKQQEET